MSGGCADAPKATNANKQRIECRKFFMVPLRCEVEIRSFVTQRFHGVAVRGAP